MRKIEEILKSKLKPKEKITLLSLYHKAERQKRAFLEGIKNFVS